MNVITNFCKNSTRISVCTNKIESIQSGVIRIDLKNDEIWRTRHYAAPDLGCLFDLKLNLQPNITLSDEIRFMKTIEMFYPRTFTWRFNGKHIECLGFMPMKNEYLGIYGRYRTMYGFIKLLRDRLLEILKFRNYQGVNLSEKIKGMLLSTGSINNVTGLYVVDILPTDDEMSILEKSKNRKISNYCVKNFDMKFWVKEINPDFYREDLPKNRTQNKTQLTKNVFSLYPNCIKELCGLKKKGNYNRFLLSCFLLGIHHERDAKHQLDMILTDEEKQHVQNGNCKDQWRAIVSKGYSPPSCKVMIENGFCKNSCERPFPHYLEQEDKKK